MARDVVTPVGQEDPGLVVSTAAVALADVPSSCNYAVITVETAGVRYRDDGTNPTAAIGTPLAAGAVLIYNGDPSPLKFIRSGGADATVQASYYQAP